MIRTCTGETKGIAVRLVTLIVCLFVSGVGFTAGGASERRPNFVLIVTDDQGYGDVGIHGNRIIQTPHLDRFAAKGVQLARFYTSPVCAPTRASLMTGRYYYRTGVIHIGCDAENPVRLCRYQDGTYQDGIPHGWRVAVEQRARYRFTINRGEFNGPGALHVSWQGRQFDCPLDAGENTGVFGLQAGNGMIDVWFVEAGKQRVALTDNSTIGDTDVELLH